MTAVLDGEVKVPDGEVKVSDREVKVLDGEVKAPDGEVKVMNEKPLVTLYTKHDLLASGIAQYCTIVNRTFTDEQTIAFCSN